MRPTSGLAGLRLLVLGRDFRVVVRGRVFICSTVAESGLLATGVLCLCVRKSFFVWVVCGGSSEFLTVAESVQVWIESKLLLSQGG
jgi:hypothetical protein